MDETGAKITALDPLTGADASNDDLITLVDVSDNDPSAGAMSVDGTNKKITLEELDKRVATLTNKTLTSPVINTPTGDIVTPTGTQTLTNKTLTSPVINTPTGDIVTPTGTQTLTNKTLTEPTIHTFYSRPIFYAISDDSVRSFAVSGAHGLFIIYHIGAGASRFAFFSWRTPSGGGNACSILWQNGTSFAASTSVLTGTTGTDGKITVSSNGGNLYVENRLGAEVYHGSVCIEG